MQATNPLMVASPLLSEASEVWSLQILDSIFFYKIFCLLINLAYLWNKTAKANVQQWSMQQLMFWLESNRMKWLKPVYKEGDDSVKKYIREDTKMFQKRQDKNNEVLLKGGTADKMIAFTTLPDDATLRVIWSEGDDYLQDFLMTFYGFSTPAQLLEVLKSRYTYVAKSEPDSDGEDDDEEGPAESQTTVNVLKAWIDAEHGIDFELDESLLKKFEEAVDTFSKEHGKELKKHLKKTLKEKGEKKKPEKRKDVEIPAPILPKKKEFTLLEIDPIELARQLTLMDERLYSQIRPKEFLKQAWAKKDHETRAPNLSRFSQQSNRIINWITTEILKLPDAESRAELIQNFIKCAKQLSQLQNFNGVMEVLSSLHSSSVSRLQQTWDLVPSKLKDIFEELTTMMSSQKNFKTYREMLTNIDSSIPCIPFLAMFLSDCIYLDDCLPDMLEDMPEFVNWDKWKTFANKVRDMKRFTAKYPLKAVESIQEFITQAEYWDDDKEMFRISQLRENKDQASVQNAMQQSGKPGKEKKGGAGGNINLKSMYLGAVSAQMNELSDREWQILLTGAVLKKYTPGAIILDIGLTNQHLYRIKDGTVRVDKEINGERVTVDKMGQDAMFGEVSMLLRQQQGTTTAAIVADTEVELWELEVEFVLKLCESEPALSEKLHRILAVKLARRLKNLGAKPKSNNAKAAPQDAQVKRLLMSTPSSATLKASMSVATLEQEVKKEDEKFIKLFKLPATEIVLKDFRCEMKPSKVGTLYVSPNFICFYSSVIGLKTKVIYGRVCGTRSDRCLNRKCSRSRRSNRLRKTKSRSKSPTRSLTYSVPSRTLSMKCTTSSTTSSSSSNSAPRKRPRKLLQAKNRVVIWPSRHRTMRLSKLKIDSC